MASTLGGCIPFSRRATFPLLMRSTPRWLRISIPKSFKDSVSWTHACQLINIFPPALIGSQEIMELTRSTHAQSADEKGHQHYSFKGEVPCFPYTETPILPQVLYRAGLSSKEGLQEHDSV